MKLTDIINNQIDHIKLIYAKNEAELKLFGGIGVSALGVVGMCRATLRSKIETQTRAATMQAIEERLKNDEGYTKREAGKDVMAQNVKTGVAIAKHFVLPVAVYASGQYLIVSSHSQLHKQNQMLAGAYASAITGYNTLKERLFEQGDKKSIQDIADGYEETTVTDEDGNEKTVIAKPKNMKPTDPYLFLWDETTSTRYTGQPVLDLAALRTAEKFANLKLLAKGYLFLNDVLKELGLPLVKEGQIDGWIYDENNPTQVVSFGLEPGTSTQVDNFLGGLESSVYLRMNVQPNILSKVPLERVGL